MMVEKVLTVLMNGEPLNQYREVILILFRREEIKGRCEPVLTEQSWR